MQAVLGWLYSCPTSFTLLAKQSIWSWEINPKTLASLCSNVYNSYACLGTIYLYGETEVLLSDKAETGLLLHSFTT